MKKSTVVIGFGGEQDNSREKISKPKKQPEIKKTNTEQISPQQPEIKEEAHSEQISPRQPETKVGYSDQNSPQKFCITKKCLLFSLIPSAIILVGIILMIIFLRGGKNEPENKSPKQVIVLDDEEAKKMIETEFEFSTKVGDLNRINVEQKYVEEITSYGLKYFQHVNRKTLYDIYIISETNSTEETKYFYKSLYTAAILISSQCINTKDEDCEPQTKIGLTEFNKKNLRFLDEIPDLKDIPLPLCIFNITDNDVITSIACHKSLPKSTRKSMILDLYFFRPPAIKRPDKEANNVTITKTKKDGLN